MFVDGQNVDQMELLMPHSETLKSHLELSAIILKQVNSQKCTHLLKKLRNFSSPDLDLYPMKIGRVLTKLKRRKERRQFLER